MYILSHNKKAKTFILTRFDLFKLKITRQDPSHWNRLLQVSKKLFYIAVSRSSTHEN